MTTEVIDIAFHGTSFPSTYIGKGTIIGNPLGDFGSSGQRVRGKFTSNGNAVNIPVGFMPARVKVVNTTDGITWEWQTGMPVANSVKTVLGGSLTSAQDTGSAITASGSVTDGTGGNGAVLLSATLCGSAKNIAYDIS